MERALAYSDVHDEGESPRAQSVSLLVGAVLAILAVAVSAVLAVWRPQPEDGGAAIVLVRDSGALYVRVRDVLHPVFNLTSARLIAGTGEDPRPVPEAALTGTERGALVGIPGAPAVIGTPLTELESRWTVCDDGATTVIAGALDEGHGGHGSRRLATDEAVLVSGPSDATFLLYGGRRARIDLIDPVVVRALGIENLAPVPVSRVLLDMVPEVAPITPPPIPGAGAPGPIVLPGFTVGEVVQVHQAGGVAFYVVLAGGVQRIGQVAADLIRHSGPSAAVTAVAPALINQLPTVGALPVDTFPDRIGALHGGGISTLCASWYAGSTEFLAGGTVPLDAQQIPVRLAQADDEGPMTDAVHLPAGRSAYVHADGTRASVGSVITGSGVRFPVGDAEAARILALPDTAVAAPRAVLEALPLGPGLTRSAALTAYDVVPVGPPWQPRDHRRTHQQKCANAGTNDRGGRRPVVPGVRRRGVECIGDRRGGVRRRRMGWCCGADRRHRVHDAVADHRVPSGYDPACRRLDALHHLPRSQFRKPGPQQRGHSADHWCGVAGARYRHIAAEYG